MIMVHVFYNKPAAGIRILVVLIWVITILVVLIRVIRGTMEAAMNHAQLKPRS